MGMITSSGFANQTITILNKTTAINADYTVTDTYVEGSSYASCVYSKTLSEGYVDSGLWKADTLYVAMIDYTTEEIPLTARVRMNDVVYAIDYVDDVAFQHEAIFIGLRAVK